MKRLPAVILALLLTLALCACGTNGRSGDTANAASTQSEAESAVPAAGKDESEESREESAAEAFKPESEAIPEISGADAYFQTTEYYRLLFTAFGFFKAYATGDAETAFSMAVSPDDPCFEHFDFGAEQIGTLDNVNNYAVEIAKYVLDGDGEPAEATIDIHFSVGDESIRYMIVRLIYTGAEEAGVHARIWKVVDYDFDA
ncbi:MAG: hypothetical protein J5793_02725 [Clostridia bacterium]|nr:hypothetical protein [Clostridia bacterium]